ncbi:PREDICTED: MLO-like protein 9 [Ipomoea nil]|uniref:MLO-like protein 9 n=1 Tax=Ipomoea nil TaxID=35883 RepID=UPI00090112C1|nr:PREDICTED: MLO-like protein 9 [Ipomoea nil]
MAGGGGASERELDQTPTWAVALVCVVIIIISILLEKFLHSVGSTFERKRKRALYEALQKIKGELMVLGFISLLLTFGQNYIAKICIPATAANTMLPCPAKYPIHEGGHEEGHHRRLLWYEHRLLSADSSPQGCKHGYEPLISIHGLHQLHIFIFFLAVFHVIFSVTTMMLGRMKIRGWKDWEDEITSGQTSYDPSKIRFTKETSFIKGNTRFMPHTPVLFYLACFFRQFYRSVCKADYLAMRHGFVTVHLAPGSNFNFQKYIKRSMEDDFKVVVGINFSLWLSAVLYLLLNVNGWQTMLWLSILPFITLLVVGTKLQAIITQMAIEIEQRHDVVQGIPLVQVSDTYFWFSRPKLVLHLIHLTLFQNAFDITYFLWNSYEFGSDSCFHESFHLAMARVAFGIGVQFMCSYITLPLYALVTQMGSSMKQSIFDEHTSKALMNWRKKVQHKNHDHHDHVTGLQQGKLGGSSSSDLPDTSAAGQCSIDNDDHDYFSSASRHTIEIRDDQQQDEENSDDDDDSKLDNNIDLLTPP